VAEDGATTEPGERARRRVPQPAGARAEAAAAEAEAAEAEAEAAEAEAEAAEARAEAAEAGTTPPGPPRYGRPGRPFTRSPFVVGLLGGLGLALAYVIFLLAQDALRILILVFIAAFFAVGLNPAVVRLRKLGLPRGLAVAAVGLGVVLLACGGLLALVPPIVTQTSALVDNLPGYLNDLQNNPTIRDLNERYDVVDRARSVATPENMNRVATGVLGGLPAVFGAIFNVLTVAVLTIYFMAAFDRLKHNAYQLVPASRRERVQLLGDEILTKVGAYMAGALAIALIAGASTFLFLLIVGVAYPFALAVVVAVCDLIPQVGATIGSIVATLIAFATSGLVVGIACLVFFIAYQQLENFFIYPRIMARAVKVSDLAALVAVLVGATLLGIVGALIAIPAVAAVQLIGREVLVPRQARS
jgi:predicted PurR-regulated permease PerM